ncbi:MAG: ankyrin repeat domain-containing protein [Proteobacteria bacterium]|nr:ankyrin repeat domain-containing protein [Pseudomonadota bacterium]
MSLSDEILYGTKAKVIKLLKQGVEVDEIDKYGFTPLIEATLMNKNDIAELLIDQKASVSLRDATGNSPLHWAVENNNIPLCQLYLEHKADPNAYNYSAQPVLAFPLLRGQKKLKQLLYQYGGDLNFAQDYIHLKLLGHRYELNGQVHIVTPSERMILLDFEGFFLEFTLGIIQDSLTRYQNHYTAKHLRNYFNHLKKIINALKVASELVKYRHYTVNIEKFSDQINPLLIKKDPLILPIAYEGHAITWVRFENWFIKCDRNETNNIGVAIYRMKNPDRLTPEFYKYLLYQKHNENFVLNGIDQALELQFITELPMTPQTAGNCSWANVEACVPALMMLLLMKQQLSTNIDDIKKEVMDFYRQWHEWDQDRAIEQILHYFIPASEARQASYAAALAAVLFQRCNSKVPRDLQHAKKILKILTTTKYQYILKSYIEVYWEKNKTAEGKNLMKLLEIIKPAGWF